MTKFLAIILCALFLSIGTAQAASIGYVSAGDGGVLTAQTGTSWDNGGVFVTQIQETYTATLAAYSSIRFDFSVTSGTLSLWSETLKGTGGYNGTVGGVSYWGQANTDLTTSNNVAATGTSNDSGQMTGGISLPLLISLSVVVDAQHAYIIITNYSGVSADISAYFRTELANYATSGFVTSYTVTPVPLPAALPLFGLGFAGLAGFRARRKKA